MDHHSLALAATFQSRVQTLQAIGINCARGRVGPQQPPAGGPGEPRRRIPPDGRFRCSRAGGAIPRPGRWRGADRRRPRDRFLPPHWSACRPRGNGELDFVEAGAVVTIRTPHESQRFEYSEAAIHGHEIARPVLEIGINLLDARRLVAGEQRGENRDARLGDAHPGRLQSRTDDFDGLLALGGHRRLLRSSQWMIGLR